MTALLLLALIALIDAALSGYRAAAGRNALIHKGAYYRRAMIDGLVGGLVVVAVSGLAALVLLATASHPDDLMAALLAASARVAWVALPFAMVVALAGCLRLAPSVDLRSLVSVLIFGPFVLARPFVAALGVAWGVLPDPRGEVIALAGLALALMLGLEPALDWRRQRRPHQAEG